MEIIQKIDENINLAIWNDHRHKRPKDTIYHTVELRATDKVRVKFIDYYKIQA